MMFGRNSTVKALGVHLVVLLPAGGYNSEIGDPGMPSLTCTFALSILVFINRWYSGNLFFSHLASGNPSGLLKIAGRGSCCGRLA